MNYKNFELQDFLNDDSFVQWVLTGKEDAYWQHVRTTFPSRVMVMEKAREMISQLKEEEENNTLNIDEDNVLQRIMKEIESQDSVFEWPTKKRKRIDWLKYAAVFFIFAGIGWVLLNGKFKHATSYQDLVAEARKRHEMTEKVNNTENPLSVKLEDGSVVTLQKNSRLSYPVHFESSIRETFLSGEAFFEVAKNPEKPFFVYANELVTKVLGTSFVITSFEGQQQASVNVRTGQVSVFSQVGNGIADGEAKGVILLPNQKAVFDRKDELLSKHLSDSPVPLVAQADNTKKRFEDVPVAQVLKELEELYGVKIIYNKEVLASCIISTILGNESLNDKLDVICQTIGATHKEMDAQIIIESTGCL